MSYCAWIKKGGGKFCSKECHRVAQTKGPSLTRQDGYVSIKFPDHHRANAWGYVYEHILVAEKKLGRTLLEKEVVHHINRNPSDNRPENLQVCENVADHFHQHAKQRILDRGGKPETDRICHKCKRVLPKTAFSQSSSRGKRCLSSACKSCAADYQKQRRAAA